MSCSQSPQRWSERESGGWRGRRRVWLLRRGGPAGGAQDRAPGGPQCVGGVCSGGFCELRAPPCCPSHACVSCSIARASAQSAKGPQFFLLLLLLWFPGTTLPGPLFLPLSLHLLPVKALAVGIRRVSVRLESRLL